MSREGIMRVGITGHQDRPGIDWRWVHEAIEDQLAGLEGRIDGFTALATEADQIFATALLDRGGALYVVLPPPAYGEKLSSKSLRRFQRLLRQATETFEIGDDVALEDAYLRAGRYIVDSVHALFAVWDGNPAHGPGEPADVVAYARSIGRPVMQFDPVTMRVHVLS